MREENANFGDREPRKFYGKYRGICKDNLDPQKIGRIRAVVPEIAGSSNLLNWALPCMPFGPDRKHDGEDWGTHDHGEGIFAVPEIESGVWIEFEAGNPDRPIWVGVWHGLPKQQGDVHVTGSHIEGQPVPKGQLRWETTPHEAWHSTDPDTGLPDYPREKVWKSARATFAGFRRLLLKLDLDDDDPVGIEPYISLGLGLPQNLADDRETGHRNKHDVKVFGRDTLDVAVRDDYTEAGRHILELAVSDIVRQAYARIDDLANDYVRIQSDPNAANAVDNFMSQFGPEFEDPAESAFVHPDDPSQHSTKSIWESTFATDTSKIKMSAFESLILQSRRADIHMSTGKIGDLNTFNDASPPESQEGDDIGRSIIAAASNGVVIEAFVRTDSEVAGTGDYQAAKAIHLFHRGPNLPYASIENPPIEIGRRWEGGVGSARYLHPNGDAALPPNKTFHRLLDERAAVSFNRHAHPYDFEIQLPDQTIPFEGSFRFTPTWGTPWAPPWDDDDDDDIPVPTTTTTTIQIPGSNLGVLGGFAPAGAGTSGGAFGQQGNEEPVYEGPTLGLGTPSIPLGGGSMAQSTAGGLTSGSSSPVGGAAGAWGGPAPREGSGMASLGALGTPAALPPSEFRIPPPKSSLGGGWDPFGSNVTQGGFMGALISVTGTDTTPGALGQIGATLEIILDYLECNTCFDFEEYSLGKEVTDFSSFGAKWWEPTQTPLELNLPDMTPGASEMMPVYVQQSPVLATRPPADRSTRAYDPFSPDSVMGANATSEQGMSTFGVSTVGDPKWSDEDLLPYGAPIEPEALSQDLGSTFLRRVLGGPQRGSFDGEVTVPGQLISWEGKTGPPCPPDRWVPTYHTPEDAWGTSIPGVITGFVPYPGASDEGNVSVMTEFTRAN